MNLKVIVFFLTVIGCTIAGELNVLDLTDDDFLTRLADIDTSLVMFYDLECTYCNKIKLELVKASELLSRSNQQFGLATVNCEKGGKNTCAGYFIDNFPTIKVFRKTQIGQDFNELPNAAYFVKFLTTTYGPASTEIFSVADMEEFLKHQEAAVIGFFEKDTELKTSFFSYADLFKTDYRFAYSSADDVLSKYNEKNAIVFFRAPQYDNKFEPRAVTFNGNTAEELLTFIKSIYNGLVGYRTKDNIADFEAPYVIAYYSIDYANNIKKTNYWRNRILQVAKDFSEDYTFAISDNKAFKGEMNRYDWGYAGEKPVIGALDKENRKFKMTAEFSAENFKQFLSDLKDGNLEPFIRSEPIPDTNDEPVKIAVAKSFDEVVINNGKDTFIEFHAPWCGYCAKMEPVVDELGKAMLEEDVEIVKFNADANDQPKGYEVTTYPSFYWLSKKNRYRPVKYTGAKELEAFIKYISEHATDKLKQYGVDGDGKLTKIEL